MMLLARFQRWCHLMAHLFPLASAHRGVTLLRGWRTLRVSCDCGREFYSPLAVLNKRGA